MENKKLLVHLHLFYQDQLDFMLKKLKNISDCKWDLYVTITEENSETERKLKTFAPNVKIIKINNIGYDIWPFIKVIQSVNLDNYDYVLKIHTKNYQKKLWLNGFKKKGFWWRNELINAILKDKNQFKKNLSLLSSKSDCGMVCSKIMLWDIGNYWPEDTYLLKEELNFLKFKSQYKHFCAGTMFLARANIFKFLQNKEINEQCFTRSSHTKETGTRAHTYERIFCIAVDEFGYKIYTNKNKKEYIFKYIKNLPKKLLSIFN
ncbi:MAG TPA: hypothetical protein IAD11_10745 [Candidatus Stercorousia faecigallinarum]|nr:hypothetical protein [Candidatus Stercorousia faecigallinarum]